MTFVIGSACIDVMDKSCIEVCPVDCIYADDEDRMCFVEPVECIDCGVCEAACPVGAIFRDTDLPSEQSAYLPLNALWFENKDEARKQVDVFAD